MTTSLAVKLLGMSTHLKMSTNVTYFTILNLCAGDRERILLILEKVKQLSHQNILTCIHFKIKQTELVMITELITAGSIREYVKHMM